MAVKNYFLPQSLDEAVALLAKHGPSLLVMAGGTVAMPLINDGISMPEQVMGLRQAGLGGIGRSNGAVTIGATTTLTELLKQDELPMLQQAAAKTAGWSIRNMATVGGNVFAPPPAGDMAVVLLALDAKVNLVGPGGERVMPLVDFYTGFMTTQLEADELLAGFKVPAPQGAPEGAPKGVGIYVKHGRKQANTPAVVSVAARVVFDGDKVETARIAVCGAGPHVIRAVKAEAVVVGNHLDEATIAAASAAAVDEAEPFSDSLASEWYRRRMVGVFVGRALSQLAGKEE